MFLWFYQGSLVDAGNAVRSKEEMVQRSVAALGKGRRGEGSEEGFSFRGVDNSLLDGVSRSMSLLRPVSGG